MAPPATDEDPAVAWYRAQAEVATRCDCAAARIAAQGFQDHPQALELRWIRAENADLFAGLDAIGDAEERRRVFHDYAIDRFWLHEDRGRWPTRAEREQRSHVGTLRGWGYDSNGPSGAVLKGWAVSRFGLRPMYHGGSLDDDARQSRFEGQRLRGAGDGIGMLLDLLFTFCQDELRRVHRGNQHLLLYRGTHDPEAYRVHDDASMVEFNCISSFTSCRERAWEFGSAVWKVRVPLAKIVFFSGLLPDGLLCGEDEYLVLGGDYRVEAVHW